jgi:hypothetical protein
MASNHLDEKQRERRFKRMIPKLLEDIDAMSVEHGVEVCFITKGPRDSKPTIWASRAMTEELFEPNKAELNHLLKMKKIWEDASVMVKQIIAETEKESHIQ